MEQNPGKPSGLLQLTEILLQSWNMIPLDFITDIPSQQGYTITLVVVNIFTKLAHFIPYKGFLVAQEIIQLFLYHVFRYRELVNHVTVGQGGQFTSKIWKAFFY